MTRSRCADSAGSLLIEQSRIQDRGNAAGSFAAVVKIVASQALGRTEGGDPLPQSALLALQALGFGLAGAEFEQKPLYQRGYGRVPLGHRSCEPACRSRRQVIL